MSNKKVLDYIKKEVEKGFTITSPSEFAYICKNILNLADKDQGTQVEKYFEKTTPFERVAEDGIAIDQVGHKGDLKVEYNRNPYYPNVKSTMVSTSLFLETRPDEMGSHTIKVFDSSRNSAGFSLGEKIKQIGGDLIIIHFAWSASLLRGAISVTCLQEMADYYNCSVKGLFTSNEAGHWKISVKELNNTAKAHNRVNYFDISVSDHHQLHGSRKDFSLPSIVELMNE